jgi:hypothetical protein
VTRRTVTVLLAAALVALAAPVARASNAPSGTAAARDRATIRVVRLWSARLNARDDAGAASLFRLPAIVIQGDTLRFHSRARLAEWHSLLPCSGRITSIVVGGRFATAVFRLGDRRGAPCDSRGALVAARFEIVGGKIVRFEQIPVPAGQLPFRGASG